MAQPQTRNIPTYSTFNRHYLINASNLNNLAYNLNNNSFVSFFSNLFLDKKDFFVSSFIYPINVLRLFNTNEEYIKLGNQVLNNDTTDNHPVEGRLLENKDNLMYVGQFFIRRISNDFMDFSEKIELFLPYASTLNLDPKEVMGKIIDIYLSIEFDCGMGTYWILVDGNLLTTSNCKIGIEMPIGKTNNEEVTKNIIASSLSVIGGAVTSIASEGMLSSYGLATAFKGASTLFNADLRLTRGNTQGGTNILPTPTRFTLIRTRHRTVNSPSDYVHFKGRPLREKRKLDTLKGYTKCNDAHIENFGSATEQEKRHIEFLLKNGVIL